MTGLTEKASIRKIIFAWLWVGKKKNRCKKTNELQILQAVAVKVFACTVETDLFFAGR
jgi:hypothetical protein